ncbi:MAG TPA: GNAT family N-acetyltransferase [Acidimicrobiales bacterium]|nr:GNAT family N-acetyltransferase [Acidimicrobiales bacterium]
MVAIHKATKADRPVVAAALASAFSEDPLFGWMIGPRAPLERRMQWFFDAFLKMNLRKPEHLVFAADDGSGAAIWQPVDKWKVPPADLLRSAPAIVRTFRARVPAMMGALNAIEKVHPKEPHYYLEVLGTRRDRQSKGVGSAVIEAGLERCDREGLPAYLESSNPRNVPFYARHGFTVTGEVDCGKGAPLCTTMWREPRA